jgi:hypothetical protein
MLRIMRFVCGRGLPAALVLIGISAAGIGVAAAQGSPETRQACTPDAMRLCSEFIPDVPKITRCMIAKHAQLSRPCRLAMAHGHGYARGREHYRHHRYYRHYRHRHCRHHCA